MSELDELSTRLGNEDAHAGQVAELALALFDATRVLFGAPASGRPLLAAAARLHDAAYGLDPRRHAETGARLFVRRRLEKFSRADRAVIAALIRMHPAGLSFAGGRAIAQRLPDPGGTLYLAALLRIADALDHGHLQDTFIVSSEGARRRIRFDVRSPLFPRNVELARHQARLWREAFPADVDFRLLAGGLSRKRLLEATLPLPEAVRRLLFLQYRIFLLNVEGARGGETTEALHDLRIAIRRMRVVLRAFAKPLAGTSAGRIEAELQRLNRVLGSARDLDVWIGFFSDESMARQFAHHRLWQGFIGHQLELRRLQQATVRRHLHGAAFSSLRFRLGRFLRVELPELNRSLPFKPVDRGARRAVGKALRRALGLADLRHSHSAEKVHRLRIALRRLRYLGGAFERLLGPAIRKLSRRAHAVERILGGMRDADLALARILSEGPAPPRLLVRQLERRRRDAAAELEACWSRFEDPELLAEVKRELDR